MGTGPIRASTTMPAADIRRDSTAIARRQGSRSRPDNRIDGVPPEVSRVTLKAGGSELAPNARVTGTGSGAVRPGRALPWGRVRGPGRRSPRRAPPAADPSGRSRDAAAKSSIRSALKAPDSRSCRASPRSPTRVPMSFFAPAGARRHRGQRVEHGGHHGVGERAEEAGPTRGRTGRAAAVGRAGAGTRRQVRVESQGEALAVDRDAHVDDRARRHAPGEQCARGHGRGGVVTAEVGRRGPGEGEPQGTGLVGVVEPHAVGQRPSRVGTALRNDQRGDRVEGRDGRPRPGSAEVERATPTTQAAGSRTTATGSRRVTSLSAPSRRPRAARPSWSRWPPGGARPHRGPRRRGPSAPARRRWSS